MHPPSMRDEPLQQEDAPDCMPARMLNEFTYCPRLMYLEWIQRDFVDNADTVDGRFGHRRVDRPSGALDSNHSETIHARSVELSAPKIGLVARMDLVEADGRVVTPVDYKRGAPPDNPERSWEPERVQLCAQALILEEHGYRCETGVLYFIGTKQRVEVPIDAALRDRTKELLEEACRVATVGELPPPLEDSPKCPRCSLVGICLPDEVNLLRRAREEDAVSEDVDTPKPRRLLPAKDDALPLYVQAAGARVGKRGEELIIERRDGTCQSVRIADTSQVGLLGQVQISTQAVQELCTRGIPIVHLSHGGWLYGLTVGMTHKNVELRRQQFTAAEDSVRSLALARRFVSIKIRNCRTLLRRNGRDIASAELASMKTLAEQTDSTSSSGSLLGLEGTAARIYYGNFSSMLRPTSTSARLDFDFNGRNRRPPRDPVNALLSLCYALLVKDLTAILLAVGFDPFLGFYHRPRYGRPALALDFMEEFRPLIADSVVITVINTGAIQSSHLIRRGFGVALTNEGRATVIDAYERRLDELVTHPVFGYRISYRRVLEVQARLLARHLAGEIPELPPFCTR